MLLEGIKGTLPSALFGAFSEDYFEDAANLQGSDRFEAIRLYVTS